MPEISIRSASNSDVPEILDMIGELADFERAREEAVATVADLETALFGDNPSVFAVIAEVDGVTAGFALYFKNFSTWLGKHGLYLEDLYVRPAFRGQGIGAQLLSHLAQICVDNGYPRFEWWVLDWNESARNVYGHLGAQALTEWIPYRIFGDALNELARKEPRP
ncbi:MAG: GNAT family N-acetyltransferase [Candidatus Nanopelagicales bacterium]|nr:GNAT family N-acetyltransferase [Candidatus Nanopelagicales bacterium]